MNPSETTHGVRIHTNTPPTSPEGVLDATWLRQICRDAGAHDVGFVEVERPALANERPQIERAFRPTQSLVSFVVRMNRENIRSPARSVANNEFHQTTDDTDAIARRIVAALERSGVRALCPPGGFPMEASRWMTERMWVVSHKPVAVAAGLGHMGIHRNVIHPRFGNFILLGTVLVGAPISEYDHELDYNPCLSCKLCVAACPVGAIGSDGAFNFSSCYTHNYREFMGGFVDWVEKVTDSDGAKAYRTRVNEPETISMWQSLAYGPNYKAAYCMAVCPAGDDVIGQYRGEKRRFVEDVVRPLQAKEETLYVIAGSDAEVHARKRFPHKRVQHVRSSTRPGNIQTFLAGLPLSFQREASAGLEAIFHFTFTGKDSQEATVTIKGGQISVERGLRGQSDVHIVARDENWLRFIRGEANIFWELLLRRIQVRGPVRLLRAFGRCFPS